MTDHNTLLTVRNLTKIFAGEAGQPNRRQRDFIVALERVSFELHRGEAVGLIGSNGSGKTTLLRLIAGTSVPTSGEIARAVRPRAIISMSGNLNNQLTARENIYLYGSMLHLTRSELRDLESGILQFAGLSDVADEPVRQFSLGMKLRLAFAIATSGRPDLLLIDEVITAGDAAWQVNGLNRLTELRRGGAGLLLATHDLSTMAKVVDRVIWLSTGRIKKIGPAAETIAAYRANN